LLLRVSLATSLDHFTVDLINRKKRATAVNIPLANRPQLSSQVGCRNFAGRFLARTAIFFTLAQEGDRFVKSVELAVEPPIFNERFKEPGVA